MIIEFVLFSLTVIAIAAFIYALTEDSLLALLVSVGCIIGICWVCSPSKEEQEKEKAEEIAYVEKEQAIKLTLKKAMDDDGCEVVNYTADGTVRIYGKCKSVKGVITEKDYAESHNLVEQNK